MNASGVGTVSKHEVAVELLLRTISRSSTETPRAISIERCFFLLSLDWIFVLMDFLDILREGF